MRGSSLRYLRTEIDTISMIYEQFETADCPL